MEHIRALCLELRLPMEIIYCAFLIHKFLVTQIHWYQCCSLILFSEEFWSKHRSYVRQICRHNLQVPYRFHDSNDWFLNKISIHIYTCLRSICVPDVRVQLKRDGTRWRTGGELKGKLANGVGSQYSHTTSEHGVSSITTADAHTSAASSRLNWRPCRFKLTRPFRRKTKSGFCARAITFQTQSTTSLCLTVIMKPKAR
jgi:hypothetical protein